MSKKMKWNQILDAATIRYQQIITAYNKADCTEMEDLCLSSLFGGEDELYGCTLDEEQEQVKDLCKIMNERDEFAMIKDLLRNAQSDISPNWYNIREQLAQMLADWYTDEPNCIITNEAFQMYKYCANMTEYAAWEYVLAPLAQYMEVNLCKIKASSKEDFVNGMMESLLKD